MSTNDTNENTIKPNTSSEDLNSNSILTYEEMNFNDLKTEHIMNDDERVNTSSSPNTNDNNNNSHDDLANNSTSSPSNNNQDSLNKSLDNGENNNNNTNHNSNNRKRKYDDNESMNGNKRNNSNNRKSLNNTSHSPGDEDVYLKLLIPSSAAGGVIGRGGEKIAQIQKDANVRMKMSKANDYYPNTNERICLIIGSVRSVLRAHDYIIERIQEKPETKSQSSADEERVNQVKILIPNTTAGLLIGKGGAYIKQIKDESGAFVQISSKQTELPERIVTIDGDAESRNKALSLVVKKIAEDPQHNSVPNLNYSNLSMSSSVDSSYANNPNSMNANQANMNKYDFNSAANYLAGLNNLALLIVNCGGSFAMTADSLKLSLRNLGYGSPAIMEIIEAITVLMSYGLITKIPPAGNNFPGLPNLSMPGPNANSNYPAHMPHDNRNSHMPHQNQHHYQHQQQQQQHNNYHHYNNTNSSSSNNSSNMNGNLNSNPNNNNIGNVLQILSNTLGKVRPNKF